MLKSADDYFEASGNGIFSFLPSKTEMLIQTVETLRGQSMMIGGHFLARERRMPGTRQETKAERRSVWGLTRVTLEMHLSHDLLASAKSFQAYMLEVDVHTLFLRF